VLLSIGVLDTATRMGYLLFLPFLIRARGGSSATVGLGLALLFLGGALGKASSGWLGQRVGVVGAVVATEIATAALIVVACFTPITAMLVVLPLLGMVLNGTSSVLYGTVPELAPKGITGRAFSVVLYRSHWLRRSRANRLRGNRRPFQPDDRHSFVGVHGASHRAAGFQPP
jgi:MFS family permease